MASIERTAYPRYNQFLTAAELDTHYTISPDERSWIVSVSRLPSRQLCCALLLKAIQHLNFFPTFDHIPPAIIHHVRAALELPLTTTPTISTRTLYTYHRLIRERLDITSHGMTVRRIAGAAVEHSAQVMDNPADLINVAIEALVKARIELPAFSTLDKLVSDIRTRVNQTFFQHVRSRLTPENQARLDALLVSDGTERTLYNDLKRVAERATYDHLESWLTHLQWLDSLGSFAVQLAAIPLLKRQHFAAEAKALDAGELKDITPPKRLTLLASLIAQAQAKARDQLVVLFRRRMASFHKKARSKLEKLQLSHQKEIDRVVETFSDVLDVLETPPPPDDALQRITEILAPAGGVAALQATCDGIRAYSSNNHLPLVWGAYHKHRSLFFRMLDALTLTPTSQDQTLSDAVQYLKAHRNRTSKLLPATLDLSFASEQWQRLIKTRQDNTPMLERKHLEACIFSYLAAELKSGDMAVERSESYTDYREQLLPWADCRPLLPEYCRNLKLPATPQAFVADLRKRLKAAARAADRSTRKDGQVRMNKKGEPVLKRPAAREPSPSADVLHTMLSLRLPERNLIDILQTVAQWTNCTRHFSPRSGSDPKIEAPPETYIRLLFTYGTNMGPVEAARHMGGAMSAHTCSYLNRRHVTSEKLDAATVDIINVYNRLTLPRLWGDGSAVGTDGTKFALIENNPMAEYHFRYRDIGGVAYYHVADTYVAIFSRFVPCGTWEAIYIIDGLLKNRSDIQPRKVHADTQGQSVTVFALSHLLGIELLPRIRNWKDLVFYKADARLTYTHLEPLYGGVIDWEYLERHWQDLMQVVLSIQEGKISSEMLLRKLGNDSKKNRLYRVFQELGRVIRTLFLLRYISDQQLRAEITAGTNKVESYNRFVKWLFFGSEATITDHDPEEGEKRIKYGSLLANAVILHTTYDLTTELRKMIAEGHPVEPEDIAALSPYMTSQIKRFGDYVIRADLRAPLLDEVLRWEPPSKKDDRLPDQPAKDDAMEQLGMLV